MAASPAGLRLGPASPSASLSVLAHPDCSEAIFALLSFEERLLTLPLVCKDWSVAHRRGGLHWRDCCVDGELLLGPQPPTADAAALLWRRLAAWLTPARGAAVQRMALRRLPAVPAELQAAVVSALARLAPGLRELSVAGSAPVLPPRVLLPAAGRLAGLRQVEVVLHGAVQSSDLDRLAGAIGLEEIGITIAGSKAGQGRLHGGFPARLTTLRRLRRFALRCAGRQPGGLAVPAAVANWQGLQSLELYGLGLAALPEELGTLPSLQELCVGRNALGAGGGLPESLVELGPSLRRLELQWNGFDAGAPPSVGSLTALEELNLAGNVWGDLRGDLPPSYRQLSRLRYLTLTNCGLACLPPAVRDMAELRLLKLNINSIKELPEGPYLGRLEAIDLAHNKFDCYPSALSRAPALADISFHFGGNLYTCPVEAKRSASQPLPDSIVAEGAEGDVPPPVTAVRLGHAEN